MEDVEEVDANFLPLIYDILKRFVLPVLSHKHTVAVYSYYCMHKLRLFTISISF